MTTADAIGCEIPIDGAWCPVSLAVAHARHSSSIKRCPVCHGRVSIHVNSTAQGGFWLQHRRAHDGCLLMPRQYAGTPKPHPQAVE